MKYVLAYDTEDGPLVEDGGHVFEYETLEAAETAANYVRKHQGRTVWLKKLVSVAVYPGRAGTYDPV